MLTGKAKEYFDNWYYNDWLEDSDRKILGENWKLQLWEAQPIYLNALIVAFFDSVGIKIVIDVEWFGRFTGNYLKFGFSLYTKYTEWSSMMKGDYCKNGISEDRNIATKAAIEKANEIYNSK